MMDRKKLLIILSTCCVVILGLIITLVVLLFNDTEIQTSSGILIEGFSEEEKDGPVRILNDIEGEVYTQLVGEGLALSDTDTAKVRNGSVIRFPSNGELVAGTFIIDIENKRQSYLIYYSYDKNIQDEVEKGDINVDLAVDNNVMVFCLSRKENIIYPEFECDDNIASDDESNLYMYISPYETYMGETKITISFDFQRKVIVELDKCSDELRNEALSFAKDYINNLGIDQDSLDYEIVFQGC